MSRQQWSTTGASDFLLPRPTRPAGSGRGAAAWFVAGVVGALLLGVMAVTAAQAHAGSFAALLLAGGVCGGVWWSTRLPRRHGAALVIGGVSAVAGYVAVMVYAFLTTPWGF